MTDAELCAVLRNGGLLGEAHCSTAADRIESLVRDLSEAMRQRDAYREYRDEMLSRGMATKAEVERLSAELADVTTASAAHAQAFREEREAHAKTRRALDNARTQLGLALDAEKEAHANMRCECNSVCALPSAQVVTARASRRGRGFVLCPFLFVLTICRNCERIPS